VNVSYLENILVVFLRTFGRRRPPTWLLSLVEDETTELPLDRLPFGDLGHLISLVRGLEHVLNLLGALQPLHFIILLLT
jgi:hypothetical protein